MGCWGSKQSFSLRKVVVFQITKILLLIVPRKVITLDSVANTAVTNVRPFQGEENKQKKQADTSKVAILCGLLSRKHPERYMVNTQLT